PSLNHYGARDHYQFTRTRTPALRLVWPHYYFIGAPLQTRCLQISRGGLASETTQTTPSDEIKASIHIFRASGLLASCPSTREGVNHLGSDRLGRWRTVGVSLGEDV